MLAVRGRHGRRRTLSLLHREEGPRSFKALQLVDPSVDKVQPGSRDEVTNRPGDQDLAWLGGALDAGGHMHGDASNVTRRHFAFTGVETGPKVEAQTCHAIADRSGTAHGARG